MKPPTAILTGVLLVAATALAEPKEEITKDSCRPGLRCASGDLLSKGQCCEDLAPEPEKAVRIEKAPRAVSPIEGFALSDIHAFEVGELPTSCVVNRKKGELTAKTKVMAAKSRSAYGGCCFEHTVALPMSAGTTAAASLSISRSEDLVQITLEPSSGMRQGYVHNGKLDAGSHQLISEKLDLVEVRRLCVAIYGRQAAAHETSLTIKSVTFERAASAQR